MGNTVFLQREDKYKCNKCGVLNQARTHEMPSRGMWTTCKCIYCGNKGTSWDTERFKCRSWDGNPANEIVGFTRIKT